MYFSFLPHVPAAKMSKCHNSTFPKKQNLIYSLSCGLCLKQRLEHSMAVGGNDEKHRKVV